MSIPEVLRQQAGLVIQRPEDPGPRAAFVAMLQDVEDRAVIDALAEKLGVYPEVAVPLITRLLEFAPADVGLIVRLGHIHFSAGEDDAADACLGRAKALEGETPRVLYLEAALAREDSEKKRIYTKILTLEPGNRDVFLRLIALRKD